jgi:hypothetical protein
MVDELGRVSAVKPSPERTGNLARNVKQVAEIKNPYSNAFDGTGFENSTRMTLK